MGAVFCNTVCKINKMPVGRVYERNRGNYERNREIYERNRRKYERNRRKYERNREIYEQNRRNYERNKTIHIISTIDIEYINIVNLPNTNL